MRPHLGREAVACTAEADVSSQPGSRGRLSSASRSRRQSSTTSSRPGRGAAAPGSRRAGRLARRRPGEGGHPRLLPDRTTIDWAAGPLTFRDRAAVPPPTDLRRRSVAHRPGRDGGQGGAHLEPGVVVMPPSYVNVGAWIGADSMVDSHVLVGSCAQVGARVHLAAGVADRRRPGAARRAAGHRRGRCLRRRRLRAPRGRPRPAAAPSSAPGVTLTGTSRLYDLVAGRVLEGTIGSAAGRPGTTRSSSPGTRALAGVVRGCHGLAASARSSSRIRDAGTSARVALEGALR